MNPQPSAFSPQLSGAALPRIVGFTGAAGAGKTTAAFALLGLANADFSRLSFADPIRQMLQVIGVSGADLAYAKSQPHPLLCGRTPRHAMQVLGTEWGRQLIGPDVWVNAVNRRLTHILDMGRRAVFDDVRFDNEAAMIRAAGGIIIELDNPNLPQRMAHASEAGVSAALIDHRISAASVDELRTRILAWVNSFAA